MAEAEAIAAFEIWWDKTRANGIPIHAGAAREIARDAYMSGWVDSRVASYPVVDLNALRYPKGS